MLDGAALPVLDIDDLAMTASELLDQFRDRGMDDRGMDEKWGCSDSAYFIWHILLHILHINLYILHIIK
jgi:hypothetical protein